jgi:hypothetical protein
LASAASGVIWNEKGGAFSLGTGVARMVRIAFSSLGFGRCGGCGSHMLGGIQSEKVNGLVVEYVPKMSDAWVC